MLPLLWTAVAGLVLIVAWLSAQAAAEVVLSRAERDEHERFWGDGATADGSWAEGLRGRFGDAVVVGGVEPTPEALREIHPRDRLGRHLSPDRVVPKENRPRQRAGARLHPEGVERPVRP
jgi:hypothetical protein